MQTVKEMKHLHSSVGCALRFPSNVFSMKKEGKVYFTVEKLDNYLSQVIKTNINRHKSC